MKRLQLRYVAAMMLCMGVTALVVGAEILKNANAVLLPKLLILLLVMGVATILISHRTAGPVYLFTKSVRTIGRGDLTPRFTLRKDDDLKELGDALAEMAESLRHSLTYTLTALHVISLELEHVAGTTRQLPEAQRRITAAQGHMTQLKKDLARFTLS
jgi:methyl-accepting chemotaxis protein